ncbi:MAG: filamentous hemagglutinin N-terminal domain-containing protein [Tepidisphaeraceae bacterium]
MNFINTPAEDMVRTSRSKRRRARMMVLCAIAPIAATLAPTARAAVHLSGVVSGTASISQNGAITTIRTSNNAILNFSQFDIALGSTVNFLQPSAASRELDHVNSGTPSLVNGSIVSNGTVYLVNPAGVIFGPGAVVNVNGIYVAGSHMADQDFLNKADHFSGISGVVSNSGQIHANQVYLIGSQVINQGSIVAPNGMVAMLAGSDVFVSQQGSHVTAKVVPVVAAASANANSSQTDLRTSSMAAGDVYSLAIRHTGAIQAANVLINGGRGQVQVSGSIDASSNIAASTGGTVAITGGQVDLVSADINASGPAGGGTVDIGGGPHGSGDLAHADFVSLGSGTVVNADATNNGTGGSIALWANSGLTSSAALTARGGPVGGDGGYIETSAPSLQINSSPDASSPHGKAGSWVLDPATVEIVLSGGTGIGTSTVNASDIATSLDGGTSVTLTATGTLSQDSNAPIAVTSTGASTLVLQAGTGDMTLSGGISTGTGSLALNVELDQLNNAGNNVIINTNPININGSLKIFGGNVSLASGIGITAASVQISSGTAVTSQSLTTGAISIAGPIATNGVVTTGGAFIAAGTSFTSTTGGTINTTGTSTNGEVDINPSGAVSIGATITTGSGASGGGGIYIDYGSSSSPLAAANGTIGISAAIATGGGGFFAGGTTFTANTGGTITTSGGKVTIQPSTAIVVDAAVTTGGGVFSSTGTSFTSNTGGTINTTGTTNGEVDIDPVGAVSIGDTITTGSSSGGGIYIEYGNSGSAAPAANGTIGISAAIATGGGSFFAGGTTLTANTGGTITTTGGKVTIEPSTGITIDAVVTTGGGGIYLDFGTSASPAPVANGAIAISAAITTGGGGFFAGGTTFTANTGGTIATSDGNVTIQPSTAIILDAAVTTGGGVFSSTGTSFTSNTGGTINTTGTTNGEVDIDPVGAVSIGDTITTGSSSGGGIYLEYGHSGSAAPAANGTIGISAAIATGGGGLFAGGTTFTANAGGTITTSGGKVTIEPSTGITIDAAVTTGGGGIYLDFGTSASPAPVANGAIAISAAIATGGGSFFAGGTTFTTTTGGTIATSGGNVTVAPSTDISIGATVDTSGGAFTATGRSFVNNAAISDDSVSTGSNRLYINTTSSSGVLDTININGALTWTAGTGRAVVIEGGGDVTVEATTGSITSTGALPISVYTTATLTTGTGPNFITFNGSVSTTGAFVADGGNLIVGSPTAPATPAVLTAGTVTIDQVATAVNGDNAPVFNGAVTIRGPVATTSAFYAAGTVSFTDNQNGTVSTSGGSFTIANTGLVIFGAAITTGGGIFTSTLGSSFTSSGSGTITTDTGNVVITTTAGGDGISIGAAINTQGGAFTATGPSFSQSAAISDGGVSTGSNGFSVNTTSGTGAITISGPISWAGGAGAGRSVLLEGAGSVDITSSGSITATDTLALPVSLYSTGTSAAVTVSGIVNTTGDFVSAGGSFTITDPSGSPAPTVLTAATVTINTATVTPDDMTLNNGTVFISGPVVTHGAFLAGGTVEFLDNEGGSVTTNGGAYTITNVGLVTIGQPITTGGGNFSSVDGSGFTTGTFGSITTAGGSVTIATNTADGINIGASINTGGGGFSATCESFSATGSGTITDGGVATPNGAFLVSTSAGNQIDYLTFGEAIAWAGGTGRSVTIEGPYTIDVNAAITSTGTVPLKVVIDSTNASSTVNINSAVNISGAFVSDGGGFTVASGGSVTAQTVALETNSTTPDGQSVTAGAVTINGPIVTHGSFTVDSPSFSESASTGAITTNGGVVSLTTTDSSAGSITLESPVITGGGAFNVNSAVAFTSSGSGTINTGGGAVTIQAADTTNGISIGAIVNTGGGNFSATAPIFTNTAEISDGGVNDSNSAGLTITSTAGAIYIEGPISWAASHSPITLSYATNYGVALDSSITVNDAEPLDFANTFIALTGSATLTGGNITLGQVVNGITSGAGSLVIQSAGTVSLQTMGGNTNPIGSLTVTGNNSAPPVTTLNGNIISSGNVDFTGTVVVPTSVEVAGASSSAQTLEFDGTIQGPGGLVVADNGASGDEIRFNNNIGDQTPLAFLELGPGDLGLVAFRWGSGLLPPGVLEQQPLTTINIASGGNFEDDDVSPSPRTFSSLNATIDSYGPLTINIGAPAAPNKSNLYAVGENEKLSVYGAVTINANGGTVKTGDISNVSGNLTIDASTVEFVLRGPTTSSKTEVDTGMDLISGGEISLPGGATYVAVKGSNGTGSFDVPGFIATAFDPSSDIARIAGQLGTAFSIVSQISPSVLFGGDNLLLDLTPSTLSATIPTFVPPIPNVYDFPIFGAAPREMLVAGTLPLDFKEAFQPAYPGPVVQQDLKDTGVLTRDPTIDEILGEVDTGAIYNDLPPGPRPKAADYRAAANRLDPRSVQAFLTKYTEVFGSNPQNRKVQMSTDFQAAWDAYVSQNVAGAVSGSGFAQFCASTPSASNAQADLRQLHGLREQLGTLGLSYKEAQVAFQYNILAGMSANGMRAGDLAAAAANAGGSH